MIKIALLLVGFSNVYEIAVNGEPATWCFKMNRKNQMAPATSQIESLEVESVNECGIKCGRKFPDCQSVSYNDQTKKCILQRTFSFDPTAQPIDAADFEFLDMKDTFDVCLLESPCKNNGICTDSSRLDYSCNCTSEVYEGKNCTEPIGQILLIGGHLLDNMEIYNTEVPAKSQILDTTLSEIRAGHVSGIFEDGIVATAGGLKNGTHTSDTEMYDTKANQIVSGPATIEQRNLHGSAMFNNEMIVCGGHQPPAVYLKSCEKLIFNQGLNQFEWQSIASMSRRRHGMAMAEVNGKVYVMGGFDGTYLSDVEQYDAATDSWTPVASMSIPHVYLAATELNGKIYACGGDDSTVVVSTCERYDPMANMWTPIASMLTTRQSHSMVSLGGKIYALGGFDIRLSMVPIDLVEMYEPSTGMWTAVAAPLKAARGYPTAVVVK